MNAPQPKDGGPAFPVPVVMQGSDETGYKTIVGLWCGRHGMTLRDWFAGMAMQGELASQEGGRQYVTDADRKGLSEWCYGMADAMIQARCKP